MTAVSIYDPSTVPGGRTVRFRDILAHVEERLRYNPLLTRRLLRLPLELDYPYWVDDDYFDLEYHVSHSRLPAPGDWRRFCIHMARYHSRPLDMNRPPWEMYVVEGLDHVPGLPAGSYAIATKVHHATGDGTSLTRFFASLADADPEGTPAVPLEEPSGEDAATPSMLTLARRALGNNLRSPLRLAGGLLHAAPGLLRSAEESVRRRGAAADKSRVPVPPTRFNVPVSPHKAFGACFAPLDALRAVREQVPGATVNDVVLVICAGALRRYLEHHGELPRESLVAWVPVNARGPGRRRGRRLGQPHQCHDHAHFHGREGSGAAPAQASPRHGSQQGGPRRRLRAGADGPDPARAGGDAGAGQPAGAAERRDRAPLQRVHLQRPRSAGAAVYERRPGRAPPGARASGGRHGFVHRHPELQR